jgi:hypothetical protein
VESMARVAVLSKRPAIANSRLVVALLLLLSGTAGARHPMEPLDTSSPRATFASFLALSEEAAARLSEYRHSPSPVTHDALWRIGDEAVDLLDLSQVAPAARRETLPGMDVLELTV